MIGVRERLHHAVVGNCNGRMSPFVGPFYDVLHLGHSVHIAHLGVTVQLHPFFRAFIAAGYGEIRYFFYAGKGAEGQLVIEPVNGGNAFQLNKSPL